MTSISISAGSRDAGLLQRLVRTSDDAALTVLRLVLAIVMFPHGAQKALRWFGGPGFDGFIGFVSSKLGIPAALAVLAIAAEFLGSLGLAIGLLSRVAAFGIFCNMLVAMLLLHVHNGFFMNWSGQQAGEGFEYHLLAMGIAIAIMIRGSGAASVDRALSTRT